MTPERYRRVGEIFDAAIEINADSRPAFLDAACAGDAELRCEVESLIESDKKASDFIASPALAVTAELIAKTDADRIIGSTVAHYKIVSLLGVGGMGRVYLAEDTVLGRRVALKFLPEYFMNDKNRVQRFSQEARTASALNHPNILTVYEVEEGNGAPFIATEYVEGETLRARLRRGAIAFRHALDIAVQLADALVAAHHAGIVHRDLKPENIMIRSDAYVKVLDFGLAKLSQRHSDSGPAGLAMMTIPGAVMGTADYMSPEQARGSPVDARSDIWSLGVILYEMAAGKRPFAAATHADTIVSILEREPPPLPDVDSESSAELQFIVTKALTKDAKERYQTIKEMAVDLRELRRRLETTPADGPSTTAASKNYRSTGIHRHRKVAGLGAATLILLLGGVGYAAYKWFDVSRSAGDPIRMPEPAGVKSPLKLETLTATGQSRQVAISPGGDYVAYTRAIETKMGVWLRQLATNTNIEIVPPASFIGALAFANSGQYLYVSKTDESIDGPMRDRRALYRVSLLGGVPLKVAEDLGGGFAISADDDRIAFIRQILDRDGQRKFSLIVGNSDGSEQRTLLVSVHPDEIFTPVWSPDGRSVICAYGNSDGGGLSIRLIEVATADGSRRELSSDRFFHIERMAWLPDKSGLLISARKNLAANNQLWRISYPGMEVSQITDDLIPYLDLSVASGVDKAVASKTTRISDIWVGLSNDPRNLKKITQALDALCWTPDGRLVYTSTASGNRDLWIARPDGTEQRQLTNNAGTNQVPAVTPDNRYIVFLSNRTGSTQVWRMSLDGSNQVQLTTGGGKASPAISPDSQSVLYNTTDDWNLWKVAIDGGNPVRLTDYFSSRPAISPDGKMIAYVTGTESKRQISVASFPGGQPLRVFDFDGWSSRLQWTPDAKALIYAVRRNRVSSLLKQPVTGGPLEEIVTFGTDELFDFSYSFDGRFLTATRGGWHHDVVLIKDLMISVQ